jgi:short-subunit dehydrogenase
MNLKRAIFGAGVLGMTASSISRAARRGRYPLAGKVVFITGGSRGLGLELARQFATRGSKLVLVARDAAELGRAKKALTSTTAEVLTVAADLSDRDAAKKAMLSAFARFGHVDVLLNCAGQIAVGPVDSMNHDDYASALNANFWTAANCIEAVLPSMKGRGEGRIVNISSIGGLVGVPQLSPYVASKFALTGYSLTLRAELAKNGIKVVTVCPGLMRTGSPPKATFKGKAALEYAGFKLSASLPLLSMNAEAAAKRIVEATQAGETRVILTLQAKVAALLQAIAPSWVGGAAAFANWLIPVSESQAPAVKGESLPNLVPEALTALGDLATARNNEGPADQPTS